MILEGWSSYRLEEYKEDPQKIREAMTLSVLGNDGTTVTKRPWTRPEQVLCFEAVGFTVEQQVYLKRLIHLQRMARDCGSL